MNLSGRLNAFATVVAGPIEVTGAAVVAADVVAATVRASATIVARAVVILVVPVLIRIRSITMYKEGEHQFLSSHSIHIPLFPKYKATRVALKNYPWKSTCKT